MPSIEETRLAEKNRLAAEREAAAQSQMQTIPATPTEYVQNEENKKNDNATPGANPKEEKTNYDLSQFAKAGMEMIDELAKSRDDIKNATDGKGLLPYLACAAYDKVKEKYDAATKSSGNNDQDTLKNNNNHNPQASPCTKNTNEALEEMSYEKRYEIMDM